MQKCFFFVEANNCVYVKVIIQYKLRKDICNIICTLVLIQASNGCVATHFKKTDTAFNILFINETKYIICKLARTPTGLKDALFQRFIWSSTGWNEVWPWKTELMNWFTLICPNSNWKTLELVALANTAGKSLVPGSTYKLRDIAEVKLK